MKIETQHLPSHGVTIDQQMPASEFSTLRLLMDNGEAEFPAPIHFAISVVPLRDLIQVEGKLRTRVRFECSRCLVGFDTALHRDFSLSYSRKIPQDLTRDEADDIELTADQIGLISFRGDEIDLREALEEQVVLALPYKPLCGEDCKGMCPRCGINLNSNDCHCDTHETAGPFDALKALKFR